MRSLSRSARAKLSAALLVVAVGFLANCSGGAPTTVNPVNPAAPSAPPVTSNSQIVVDITPTDATILSSQKQQFTASVLNSPNVAVAWEVDGVQGGDAAVGSISAEGLYSPPSTAGTHSITATSMADTTKSDSANVSVSAPPSNNPQPSIAVTVLPATASISTIQTQQFSATVSNSTNSAVTWSVDGVSGGNTNIGTISTTGLYSPPSNAGIHSIIATSAADATKSGKASVSVSVNVPPPAIAVTVSPPTANITTIQTQQFTAAVSNSTNSATTWFVDGVRGGNSSAGVISTAGLYSPPSAAGTHSISATSVADATKGGSASVSVALPAPAIGVAVTPTNASISTIQTQQFIATVSNTANSAVTWSVDGVVGGSAAVGVISSTGLYTPALVEGSHSIAAVSVADPSKSSTVNVGVKFLQGVLTYHNDNARTGQTLQESILTPNNVASATFGQRFVLPVDGQIYAQPLYVANVTIGGQVRNVLFVATEHDSVYAFDADNAGSPLWQKSFIDPANGVTAVPSADTNCGDVAPEVGITSTPVIDRATGTLYVVAKTKENGANKYRLHALDIASGTDKSGVGVEIKASVPGTAQPNDGSGHLVFTPALENQRLALLLNNGVVYFGTGSYCDFGNHHGWMFAYDAKTLALKSAMSTTPNGAEGGVWEGGGGAAADADGNIFITTGDGAFDANTGGNNYGDSYLKLNGASFGVMDYFTPYNESLLEQTDTDVGSSGLILLPDQATGVPHLLVGGGKQGIVYLLNRDNFGKFNAADDSQILQSFAAGTCGVGTCALFGTPAYFNNTLYLAAVNDKLKAFSLVAGRFAQSAQSTNTFKWPGATPSISANGSNNGIVWTVERNGASASAILHAHSAQNVSFELYNSNQVPTRDAPGPSKFTIPTIANGKVYVAAAGQVAVFGLLN